MNIVIEGTMATATSPEGIKREMGLDKFINQVAPPCMDTGNQILGDGIKSVLSKDNFTIVHIRAHPPSIT